VAETIFVVGGEQRGVPHWTKEWRLYKRALVVKVANGKLQRVLEYESPSAHRPDEPSAILFKSASVVGNRAYLCTQTEILICDFPSFEILKIISLPCFNDIHHVAVAPDGRLFVAVTGLDAVAELASDGELISLTSVLGGSVWDRFSSEVDYRKVLTTKPHRSHPNFIFFLDGEPWVTRFEQRDALPLNGSGRERPAFKLGSEGVHDGHVDGDYIYFTSVNGFVRRFSLLSGEEQIFDLNIMRAAGESRPLGWCRGVLPRAAEIWVGFTRIRYTELRQNIDWIRRGFRDADRYPPAPTRIACYDLANRLLIEEIDVEQAGMNTIFSVHRGSGVDGSSQVTQ